MRICSDGRSANRSIIRSHHICATIDHLVFHLDNEQVITFAHQAALVASKSGLREINEEPKQCNEKGECIAQIGSELLDFMKIKLVVFCIMFWTGRSRKKNEY